jgi:nitrogen-specific signal transduction histidine kinase
MSSRIGRCTFSLLLIFFFTHLFARQNDPVYEFHTQWKKTFQAACPIDVNQDGEDEFFTSYEDQLDLTDRRLQKYYASFGVSKCSTGTYHPLVTGRLDSLAFLKTSFTPDSVYWRLLVWQKTAREESKTLRNYLSFSGFDKNQDGQLHQSGEAIGFIKQLNGELLQIYTLNTGRDAAKRGLMAVRPATGEIVWEFLMGPQVRNCLLGDWDRDGGDELLVGSYAPENGLTLNGTRDDSAYVFLINADGRLRWRLVVGGAFTGAIPAIGDIDGSGQNSPLVYRFSLNTGADNTDELVLLDLASGEPLRRIRAGKRFTQIVSSTSLNLCQDFDGDGKAEVVLANADGLVRMFGADLQNLKTSPSFECSLEIVEIADLTGNPLPEIICMTRDNTLIILDHDLKPLIQYPFEAKWDVIKVKTKIKHELLARHVNSSGFTECVLLEMRPVPFSKTLLENGKSTYRWLIPGIFGLLLLFLFRRWFFGAQARKILFNFLDNARILDSVLMIRRDGKVIRLGKNWEEKFGLEAWQIVGEPYQNIFRSESAHVLQAPIGKILEFPREEILFEGTQNRRFRIQATYLPLLRYSLLYLNDLTEHDHLRQVQAWAAVAQRLAHGIKNPLTTVKLNAEDLVDLLESRYQIHDPDILESLNAIISQAEKLTRMSDGFMRFVQFEKPKAQPIDLNQKILELVPPWLPNQHSIQVKFEMAEKIPEILFDAEQFLYVVKTIFFNAVESIEKSGRIVISTNLAEVFTAQGMRLRLAELQVHDTGNGILPEYLEKVFLPFFSMKKTGTGLGLHIALKVMQEHGGTIHIESEENIGTTVTLRFRLVHA